jgi:hypothetical protein
VPIDSSAGIYQEIEGPGKMAGRKTKELRNSMLDFLNSASVVQTSVAAKT